MQLPDSLQPWRQWLTWFAPEHLPLFADLLGRLNPILGPWRGLQHGGVPEPDGLGDLQRRGSYERLLSSEWLLAGEVPEEFLRRAVSGEHMFLAPHYEARQASRLIVVLFDAGPLQLGAARLVHLALLMLLARRAQEAGAELCWGILQDAPQLRPFDGAAQLKALLAARTWNVVSEEHWQTWRHWLGEQSQQAGECWLVGQRLPASDRQFCSHRVHLHRSLDGQSLTFELLAGSQRRVSLPIPEERSALQLLKGQFEGEVVAAPVKGAVPRVAQTLAPIISSHGGHVALRLLDQPGMVVIKLPAHHQKKGLEVRTSVWSGSSSPLGITFLGRSIGAVLSEGDQLRFWHMSGLRAVDKPSRDQLQLPPGTATLLPTVWIRNSTASRLLLLDSKGHLASWSIAGKTDVGPDNGKTRYLADDVMAMAKVDEDAMAYVRRDGSQLYASAVGVSGVVGPFMVGPAKDVTQVLFIAGWPWRVGFGGCALCSVENGSERWTVITASSFPVRSERIELAPGWRGIGLRQRKEEHHCALVLLGPNQRSVALYEEGKQRVLFTTSEEIVRYSYCPITELIAVLTSARELLVYSLAHGRLRLQVSCNQTPETTRMLSGA